MVKALDLKSNGIFPRRFEPYSQRQAFCSVLFLSISGMMDWPACNTQDAFPPKLQAAMAEWLRRLTRNQMGSSRVGSNPTRSE